MITRCCGAFPGMPPEVVPWRGMLGAMGTRSKVVNVLKMVALPSGELLHFAMERSTMLLMGKSTISTGPFSIAMLVHQRVLYKNQNYFDSAWRYETSGMSQGIPPIACFPQERSTRENRILTAKSIAPRNIISIIVFDDILSRYSRIQWTPRHLTGWWFGTGFL